MIERGDGIYGWYWGKGEQPTLFHGPFDTADYAAAVARSEHDGDYTVVEADRLIPDLSRVFEAQEIYQRFFDQNALLWSADKQRVPELTGLEALDLKNKLTDCLDRWVRKYHHDEQTNIRHVRKRDYFPAPTGKPGQ